MAIISLNSFIFSEGLVPSKSLKMLFPENFKICAYEWKKDLTSKRLRYFIFVTNPSMFIPFQSSDKPFYKCHSMLITTVFHRRLYLFQERRSSFWLQLLSDEREGWFNEPFKLIACLFKPSSAQIMKCTRDDNDFVIHPF